MTDISILPAGLPEPTDDGAADHLVGTSLPSLALPSSAGGEVDLARLAGRAVVYAYPMSSEDGSVLPDDWDSIPGARGCTPQHCSMRDHERELAELGIAVYGLSTQTTDYLRGEVERVHIPYPLLSDHELRFADAIRLPRFDFAVAGAIVLKRTTLIINDGTIEHVFYPVFPPDRSADQVLEWLRRSPRAGE